jgi:hypothetical protein
MKKITLALFLFFSLAGFAQSNKSHGGEFSLGIRNTASLFSKESGLGIGYGGQFRLRLYDFMNTEWFADYFSSGIGTLGNRMDYHIGWSVMFYIPSTVEKTVLHKPVPYFLAGHCFDYTRVRGNNYFYQSNADASRWSSAIQAGLGMHFPVTYKIDLSFNAQYMMHLGKEIAAETRTAANGDEFLFITTEDNAGLEGHLLLTLSINFRLADFWKDQHGALGNGPHVQEEDK